MRISPATAKFKAPGNAPPASNAFDGNLTQTVDRLLQQSLVNGVPLTTSGSNISVGSSSSIPAMTTSSTASSMSGGSVLNSGNANALEIIAQLINKASQTDPRQSGKVAPSITAPLVMDQQKLDESWKHQAQARAILGNLIGPNGEQLSSTDPYNTTVSAPFKLQE